MLFFISHQLLCVWESLQVCNICRYLCIYVLVYLCVCVCRHSTVKVCILCFQRYMLVGVHICPYMHACIYCTYIMCCGNVYRVHECISTCVDVCCTHPVSSVVASMMYAWFLKLTHACSLVEVFNYFCYERDVLTLYGRQLSIG